MNRNHMLKRKMTAGLAVGMAVAVGSVPMAMAANTANTKDSSSSVSKEETVYVMQMRLEIHSRSQYLTG